MLFKNTTKIWKYVNDRVATTIQILYGGAHSINI